MIPVSSAIFLNALFNFLIRYFNFFCTSALSVMSIVFAISGKMRLWGSFSFSLYSFKMNCAFDGIFTEPVLLFLLMV